MCAWIPHERGQFNLDNAKQAIEDFNNMGKILADNGGDLIEFYEACRRLALENKDERLRILEQFMPTKSKIAMTQFQVRDSSCCPISP